MPVKSHGNSDIADLLNSARECGINAPEMLSVLQDYFSDPTDLTDSCSDDELQSDGEIELESFLEIEEDNIVQNTLDCMADADKVGDLDQGDRDTVEDAVKNVVSLVENTIEFVNIDNRCNHCHCQLFINQETKEKERCINQFTSVEQDEIRWSVKELTPAEKQLLLLGMISMSINDSSHTLSTKQGSNPKRKITRIRWFYYGHKRICRDTFIYLMETCTETITKLKKQYIENGLTPVKKKSGGRNHSQALKLEEIQAMVRFILNFSQEHSIVLPGRIPGFSRTDIQILPSQFPKAEVWRQYKVSALQAQERVIGLSTFRKLWLKLLPYVVNVDESKKTEVLKNQEQHLLDATTERSQYREICAAAKRTAAEEEIHNFEKNMPCSRDIKFHYSFDYAQQVHYPADPMQPGPIFFKTPRKCQIFGVHCEGISKQVNYLIDEESFCGKGANAVVSMVHHFLENFGAGETNLQLNADNCSGQNKNNVMVWYLLWRTLTGLHQNITLQFLLAGHTKFAPDWCYGLLKKKYRTTPVSSLQEISDVVSKSSESGINVPQLVGDQQGNIIVTTYDWAKFLGQYFRRFDGIKAQHHFRFESCHPGVVFSKILSHTEEKQFNLVKKLPSKGLMPDIVKPKGLDDARRVYLFKEIREFCSDETKDLVCPKPNGYVEPENKVGHVGPDDNDSVIFTVELNTKKKKGASAKSKTKKNEM